MLPLVTHASLDQTIAWRNGVAISAADFLADAEYLAALLPPSQHILNICRDRYHFTVGLAAAIIRNKVSLLPPTYTPAMVQQLQTFSHDIICLHDHGDCDIELPRLRYPVISKNNGANTQMRIPQIDEQQLIAIVFTSGSTGAPIPHLKNWGSLVLNVQSQAERLRLLINKPLSDQNHHIIGTIPPQHMYGLESTVLLPLQTGNALNSAQPFYPADICDAMRMTTTPRMLVSTPLHLRLLLEADVDIPELALVLSATAPLSGALAKKVETSCAAPLVEIYGSTETGQIATRRTTQSKVWQLLPQVNLSQRDALTWAEGAHIGAVIALNDVIELIDSTHFLLHGRTQDLVNIAGKRTSLSNLNHHLNSIPGVMDGAFFIPDERSHDHVTRLSACVVAPGLTASSLLSALRRCIDPAFLPRPLLFVESLPRNSTGKLPRAALQKLIADHSHDDLSYIKP